MKALGLILSGVLLAALTGCSGLFFYPAKPWAQNPARQGLAYEDVVLIHPDGLRLHGWWLPARGYSRGTVYFLHGNAMNLAPPWRTRQVAGPARTAGTGSRTRIRHSFSAGGRHGDCSHSR